MKCNIELYFNAISPFKQKIDITNEVKFGLEMQDEYFDLYEFNTVGDFTDDQIRDILGETDIDTLMRYITVDEDSLEFSHTENEAEGLLCYTVNFNFDLDSFLEKWKTEHNL